MRGTRRTRLCLAGVMAASTLIATPAARAAERTDGHLNALTDKPLLDAAEVRRQIEARDLQMANPYSK
ncbi:hypothetical protein ABT167_39680, partial [Streptomyces sp. NPDC001792]|uniref:hypothetical protein n=1 Tax=Streptomyces sp. NPDC001792 TaxID=3154524 RepID=UPI003324EE7D